MRRGLFSSWPQERRDLDLGLTLTINTLNINLYNKLFLGIEI